jgi:hypothetical protein
LEDVSDILEMNSDEELVLTENPILGAVPENSEITVFDGESGTIFKEKVQDILFQEINNPDSSIDELYKENTLYVEDHVKGTFFQIDLEDEEEFDISKLKINITDIEGQDFVTSIEYKDHKPSFGDYWSKGIQFFVSNE